MADETSHAPKTPVMAALLVPADPESAAKVIDLSDRESTLSALQEAVGGDVEVQDHDEGDIWINDMGRLIDLPINVRANHWMLNDSTKAHEGRVGESMVMYGDVVITGPPDRDGDVTAVSQQMIDYFQGLSLAPNAMKDWDVRNTDVYIIFESPDPTTDLGDLGWNL